MVKIVNILKEKNIKVTPQRVGVYEILRKENKHMTAEQIYEQMKRQFPTVSLATVYAVLELFQEKNLIKEIRIEFDKSYFDMRTDHHHHFFCKRCKKTFDIDIPFCSTLKQKEIDGYLIDDFQGYFYGICKKCNRDKR